MSSQGHDQNIPASPQSPIEKAAPPAQPNLQTPRAPAPSAPVGYSAPAMSSSRWQPGIATFLYVFAIFVLFALSVTQMGLAGRQLNKFGYHIDGWGGRHQLKSVVGFILWNSIVGVIFCLVAFWLPAAIALVCLFVLQFFWIVAAGVINHAMPYRPSSCTRNPAFDHARFDSSCHQFAALDVISWWLWLWTFFLMLAFLIHFLHGSAENKPKRTVFGA